MWQPQIRFSMRLLLLGVAFGACLLYLSLSPMRRSALDRDCKANLHAIGLALRSYHADYGCFPPAYTVDASGRPMHSWRALIIPYAGYRALAGSYHLDEPWDGPNNSRLADQMPPLYACPAHAGNSHSSYAVVVGPETAFPEAGHTTITQIEDGDSAEQTMVVTEVGGTGIPWLEPRDLRMFAPSKADWRHQLIEYGHALSTDLSRQGLASRDQHPQGPNFLSAAGQVASLRTRDGRLLHAMFTIDGGDPYCIERP
jgi:hypothetical protein